MEYNFNYKLKFQVSLHLHHLSQVRARCPSGAHTVHVCLVLSVRAVRVWPARSAHLARPWCARGARLALPRCASGSPVVHAWCASGSPVVRAQCASGSPTVHARCASGQPTVRARCVSGSPVASSHGSWSLNHQTSRISLLSSQAFIGARPTHEAYSSMVKSRV